MWWIRSFIEEVIRVTMMAIFSLIQIAGKLNRIIRESSLKEIGQLEQDLVFGDAGTKDLINFLRVHQVETV